MKISGVVTQIDTWYNLKERSYYPEQRRKDRNQKEHKKTKRIRKYISPQGLGIVLDIEV